MIGWIIIVLTLFAIFCIGGDYIGNIEKRRKRTYILNIWICVFLLCVGLGFITSNFLTFILMTTFLSSLCLTAFLINFNE